MGFVSMVFAFFAVILTALFWGALFIIIGTVLLKKNKHKKLAVALRILGFVIIVPIIILILCSVIIAKLR